MAFGDENINSKGLRIIKTGRDIDSINKAAKNGLKPIVKKIEPSDEIRSNYSVVQNKTTGEIEIIMDHRSDIYSGANKEFERVIEWTHFYPHYSEPPFAAYLIPKDIKIGERVFIEDLIEDYIGASWQDNTYRLESCEAIWNGSDLEIQYDPRDNHSTFVG